MVTFLAFLSFSGRAEEQPPILRLKLIGNRDNQVTYPIHLKWERNRNTNKRQRIHAACPRVGDFITGASGSDKQMLCGSSVARAAPTISAVNKIQKG